MIFIWWYGIKPENVEKIKWILSIDNLSFLKIDENSITTMDAQDIYLANGFTLEDLNNLKF